MAYILMSAIALFTHHLKRVGAIDLSISGSTHLKGMTTSVALLHSQCCLECGTASPETDEASMSSFPLP